MLTDNHDVEALSRCGNFIRTILSEPWGAAVKLEDRDGPWGKFIAATIVDWHRSGKLIETEKKWGILPTAFLRREQTL